MNEETAALVFLGRIKVGGSPLFITDVGQDKLCAMDNLYTFYLIDKAALKLSGQVTLLRDTEPLHRHAKVLTASSKKDIALAAEKSSKINVMSFAKGSFAKKGDIALHALQVEVTSYSADGSLFASGGADGALLIYDTRRYNVILAPDRFGDYVSAIAFSGDNRYVASSTFGNLLLVYDLERSMRTHGIQSPGIIERMAFFDDTKLFFITRELGYGIYDLVEKKATHYETNLASWPVSLALSIDKNFAFIGTKSDFLYVIRLSDNYKLLTLKLPNETGVASLHMDFGKLFVGFVDGTIEIIDVDQGVQELLVYLKTKDWAKAADMLKKNALLALYPELQERFDEGWQEVLPKAVTALSKNNLEGAIELCRPFLDDPKKAAEFEFYTSQRQEVADFLDSVEKKDVTKAYGLAKTYPYLQKMAAWIALEDYWNKAFAAAKKLLEADPMGNRPKAQELLRPFATTDLKKSAVVGLMTNFTKYMESEAALRNRDFNFYFDLCTKYNFLKETQTYQKTIVLGESLLDKLNKFESERMYSEAIRTAELLRNFAPFAVLAAERIASIGDRIAFIDKIEQALSGDLMAMRVCYQIARSQPRLQSLQEFRELVKGFSTVSDNAYTKAMNGKPDEALTVLKPYLEIDYWSNKIREIMRTAYLNEMKNMLEVYPNLKFAKVFELYISMFGKDLELEKFAQNIKQESVLESISSTKAPNQAKTYPPSIFQAS